MKNYVELLEFEGCPCGSYRDENYSITTHCWRTGNCCSFSGVHIKYKRGGRFKSKALKIARDIKKYIEDAYRTEVKINVSPRKARVPNT